MTPPAPAVKRPTGTISGPNTTATDGVAVLGSVAMITRGEIEAWQVWLRAIGRPETTIGQRTYHVHRAFTEMDVDPWHATTDDLVTWLASKRWKPNTRRAYRASLRAFYRWAQATGKRLDDPAAAIPSIAVPRGLPRPAPEDVYLDALTTAPARVRRMLRLAAEHGLRRGEIATARRDHVLPAPDGGHDLRVIGKGGHVRYVPLDPSLATDLLAQPPGWLFPTTSTRDRRAGGHLTPAHVGVLVSRALPDGWTCHTLRHRCGTVAYNEGGRDLRAVQELLGHAKPETTALYTKVRADAVRRAVTAAASRAPAA